MKPAPITALGVVVLAAAMSHDALGRVGRQPGPVATLTGFARLPADTFADGPPSGAFLDEGRQGEPRFPSQPVQGFSSLAPARDGWWWALVDNGFGTKLNSRDALLRVYRVRPQWREAGGGEGAADVDSSFVELSDPTRQVPFPIANEHSTSRVLTGADFDPESMVVADDGTFWLGDEFGPFLLHADRFGRLLGPPIEHDEFRSPDRPASPTLLRPDAGAPTVGRSRGFEGLSSLPGSSRLVVMLEAEPASHPRSTTLLEFDPARGQFTERRWCYVFDAGGEAASEVHCYAPGRCLVIERDGGHGAAARFKRVFAVQLPDGGGTVDKRLVLDLLQIDDPHKLASDRTFRFPFVTTEAIWALDGHTLVLANDNNFPATGGRREGERDPTEFVRVRLASALP